MNEQLKARRFSVDVDRILNDSSIEKCRTAEGGHGKAEDEYDAMLDLAEAVVSVDYSSDSKARQVILDKLVRQMAEKKPHGFAVSIEQELDDDELDKVAGGQVSGRQEQGCILCGCKRTAAGLEGDTCPECGHPRPCHS